MRPARRSSSQPAPRRPVPAPRDATTGPAPVEVRLIGPDPYVRQLVAALQAAAHCGHVGYRQTRDGTGTRAYLSIIVPDPNT
ncbi:hypothetical protein ACIQJX_35085 [Streptomyces griseoviridis]